MAKQSTAEKAIDKYGVSGGAATDFVHLMFGRMRAEDAERLTEKFAAVLAADNKLARIRGKKFETDPSRADEETYLATTTAPADRDKSFARKLPHALRKQFYDVVKGDKAFSFSMGRSDVAHRRTMARLDEILADPSQAAAFYQRTEENAHLRDPIMFPKF